MIKKISAAKLFWLILALAAILRFYKLGEIPLSLDWDENSNAYNAYSIIKTGRDEYGDFLPITNRSFDDYKPPAYMYLNIPTVAVFGLTPFAARLPSAIFGFLTVPVIYFLAKKLFEKSNEELKIKNFKLKIPEIAMLFLAISPWHLQFSRVGFEATVGLFFAAAAVAAFLYGLESKKWLIVSAVAIGLSTYTYHTERIFVPLIFLAAIILYRQELAKIGKKYLAAAALVSVLIA
ncbi:glycosyltransferase family 39 protein, partial [Candidatus Woesebacteria bacterium]|nr:glycosyltransferase family 39 protein [Candidatus Woesebacteria bacterium]